MESGTIIYHLESSEQFWNKLDDILAQGENKISVKNSIDIYVSFVANFQDKYLESDADYMRCYCKLLDSPMYQMFSETIIERLLNKTLKHDNSSSSAKELLIIFNILLLAGRENPEVFKMIINKKSFNFINKLKNVIYYEKEKGRKLQLVTIQLFFEICFFQILSPVELDTIDEHLLNHLLDLVEITRDEEDETFNYSIVHLILSFSEQFMVTRSLKERDVIKEDDNLKSNPVLRVLSKRIGTSKTFGENIIFMLNRSVKPQIQMLILKFLHQIFTTPETFEYLYTNDLRVLIDVFIRELYDLPDENGSLRHAFLRVLHPLISNTQLNKHKYKQHQIYDLLLDLKGVSTKNFKPVSPVIERLVNRCLDTDYLREIAPNMNNIRTDSNSSSSSSSINNDGIYGCHQNHGKTTESISTLNAFTTGIDKPDPIVVVNSNNNNNNVVNHQGLLLTN